MFIHLDEHTSINAYAHILYIEDVSDEQGNTLTRIVFEGQDVPLPTLVTDLPRMEVIRRIDNATTQVPQELAQWLDETPVFPAPTDTPLTQEQLPFEGEDPVDYINRVSRSVQ